MGNRKGAFFTGEYRNVFREFGYSEEEISRRVTDTWNALFCGDEDTKIYYESGDDEGYLLDTGNLDVRTEGMSYGMMMCVQLDKKAQFDRIWKWARTHMYMDSGENAGYFAWSCNPDGSKRSHGPAPDGEEFFAMALLFASNRWGDGPAPFNYGQQARELLHTVLHKGEDGVGFPMWNRENKLIKFIPNCEFSDPSYHLPHFYELFALWGNEEDSEFWRQAAKVSRQYLHVACHEETGLAPEYAYYDGRPNNDRGFGRFFSDAYRVIPNLSLDYEWFRADEWQVEEANKVLKFFADKDPADYRRYTIEGEPLEEKALHPVGLLATNAVGSLATSSDEAKRAVELLWNTPVRTGVRRYYDNCLYLFSILALSGNYRVWFPEK